MKEYDVAVIGGGVIGGSILRELTKYKLSVCLLEKEADVAMGQSRANSGIVHAGFDAAEGTLKAKFNVAGNRMMKAYAEELGVKYKNNGSLVVAFSEEEMQAISGLKARGEKNGVPRLEILTAEELRKKEPNISQEALGALYAPTGGIVCPYGLTIAAIGNAMDNGAELYTEFEVAQIKKTKNGFTVGAADGREISCKLLVNCAGYGSGKIAEMAGDNSIRVGGRRGEYILLDRESGNFVSHTLFFAPTKLGKGILVSPTVDGNLLLGPTAEEIPENDTSTSAAGLASVLEKAKKMCPAVPAYNVITSFAGVRAYNDKHDFIIEESTKVAGLINCAGIESPGLTAAPAIAQYVVSELVGKKLSLKKNENFHGKREAELHFQSLPAEEKNAVIVKDPAYGKIVCRCEQISEGEIVRAIHENPPARSVDAVKRRTRAGMGRCQGGFCQPHVAEILGRELGIPFEEVKKSGKGSELVKGEIK
ncbi:MAG: NAD(P)/FAD-dependent oxidoreductase [Clostridia bacterium]|nr:NAD(P)/FAD-dependent oxidoreductase [Clostridia bacterium]